MNPGGAVNPGSAGSAASRVLRVVRVGASVTVQDAGRPGLAALGVTRSGAADLAALRLANRLVGNPPDTAGLEVLLGGLAVRAGGAHLVLAVTGAGCAVRIDGRTQAAAAVLDLAPGSLLELGPAVTGVRCYLAVRGGIAVAPVLGSRSRDTLAGLGPDPVRPGDLLPIGPSPSRWPEVDAVALPAPADPAAVVELRAVPGPRADWLDGASTAALWSAGWTVSPDGDRVGIRLLGPRLHRPPELAATELASEGLLAGAVQVPPGGPVLFLADHPVTGGYPVAAVVLPEDLGAAAQLRPGQRIRFRGRPPLRAG